MNFFEPSWDAEVDASGAVLREELLFVLSGTPALRRSDSDIRDLSPGEVIAFPAGPEGIHQILNRSDQPARVLICATDDLPEVAEQPEADQMAVITDTGLCGCSRAGR